MNRKKTGTALEVGRTPRVNLLPPEEVEERGRKALRMRWARVFVSLTLFFAVVAILGVNLMLQADGQRVAAEQELVRLKSQLAGYSAVGQVQADVANLEQLRAQAGGNDFTWAPLIGEIKAVLPTGVNLVGFQLAPGAAPKSGPAASAQVGLTGTLTFTAKTTADQAETVTRLRTVKGFLAVDAGALTANGAGAGYLFAATFSADQTRYTGRFDQVGSK